MKVQMSYVKYVRMIYESVSLFTENYNHLVFLQVVSFPSTVSITFIKFKRSSSFKFIGLNIIARAPKHPSFRHHVKN